MNKKVVLIGTSHKFQYPVNGLYAKEIQSFHNTIRNLCDLHQVQAIAEEMSIDALSSKGFSESGIKQLCVELDIKHQYSDPSYEERCNAGLIGVENDILLKKWTDNWTDEQIDYECIRLVKYKEDEWLRRIQKLNLWPLLFICGAAHFVSFSTDLIQNGFCVIEAFDDWPS